MNQNYQKICSNLLGDLPQRTVDVIERRFGLRNKERETLEAIGKRYGLTRERVRQIEKEGISKIVSRVANYNDTFKKFKKVLWSFGGLKEEKSFFSSLAGEKYQNNLFFLLTINNDFERVLESDDLYSFWAINKNSIVLAKKVIREAVSYLQKQKEPLSLERFFKGQKKKLSKILAPFKNSGKKKNISDFFKEATDKNIFQSCIEISKKIQKNPLGLYGLKNWLEINPRGIKDKAYLVLKSKNNPLHFRAVATLIEDLPFPSPKKIQTTTVHNELIKDERFVLVGRGLYALKEWGYSPGTVKDLIIDILKNSRKPLPKKEILEEVLKKRFVKENTVLLNLNDKNYFFRDDEGRYKIREV